MQGDIFLKVKNTPALRTLQLFVPIHKYEAGRNFIFSATEKRCPLTSWSYFTMSKAQIFLYQLHYLFLQLF